MVKVKSSDRTAIWISGIIPVKAALRSGNISIDEMVFSRTDRKTEELLSLSRARNLLARQESRDALTLLVGHSHHQGVALRGAEFPYLSMEDVLMQPLDSVEPMVILDSVQDPQNFGALLRSACFFGAKSAVIAKDRAAQVTATVVKVSAGATAYLPVVRVTNLVAALQRLKEKGLWIVGLDLEAGKQLYDADLTVPLGVVVGNEQKGIRPLVRKNCDLLLQIPARGPLQSLNAATAGAVALAEIQRQRAATIGRS
ncbi:MAG: 23S rRNA (guanosine(2251)-2'-O)-methyltransferase RlmB [Desulforhabdus sp.]|jgi:23S rRNA (guanosine2251-2'-O)-methyltransferase|nr:23S rRNA (guanosine(2251)-2'-O)-methyltransferase RlmB [Desulforhabdus sp.]